MAVDQLRRLQSSAVEKPRDGMPVPLLGTKGTASLSKIAGIAEDHGPLIDEVPVSEAPELYLVGRLRRP